MTEHDNTPSLGSSKPQVTSLTGQEPVLKGVSGEVLAHRLGAYRAGRLSSLLKLMNSRQQDEFQRWSVRVAVRYARRAVEAFEAEVSGDTRPRLAVDAARHWLEEPSTASQAAARRAGRAAEKAALQVPRRLPRHKAPAVQYAALAAKCTAMAACSPKPSHLLTVVSSVEAARTDFYDHKFAPEAVRRAQLRAAYVILSRGL